jgi:hypothetical protein
MLNVMLSICFYLYLSKQLYAYIRLDSNVTGHEHIHFSIIAEIA